jgi:hypothetical protein
MNNRPVLCVVIAILLSAHLHAQYLTGFESPPFASGAINGQDSWTTSAVVDTARVRPGTDIATDLTNAGFNPGDPVHSGSQALMVSGAGGSNATIRAIAGLSSENKVTLDVWARPLPLFNGASALGNIFLTMEDPAGDRAAAFRFGTQFGNTIDYGSSIPTVWVASTAMWDNDTWYHLTMALDYGTKTYNFIVNGTQVNTEPIPFYNALSDNFDHIRIFRGANQAGMLVDDLVVIPEPATVGSLLLGASAMLIRRRVRNVT